MTVFDMVVGSSAQIIKMDNPFRELKRLNETGILTGVKITLLRRSPLNSLCEISATSKVCIAKSAAKKIYVKVIN